MRLQDQAASTLLARAVNADDDRRIGMLRRILRPARMSFYSALIHAEAIDSEPMIPIGTEYEVLDGVLGASNRFEADQCFCVLELLFEAAFDRLDDLLPEIARGRHHGPQPKITELSLSTRRT